MKKAALLGIALVSLLSVTARAQDPRFSIDPASPAVNGGITPDDVLRRGPVIFTPGTALGLLDGFANGVFDNLDALSYGQDPIRNPLYFSVDRVAVGVAGTDVFDQAAPALAEAAGDVFVSLPPAGDNLLFIDEEALGLTPGFFGDDLDALEIDTLPAPWTYFSIDRLSATNGFGAGTLANDILISPGNGAFGIFALGELNMGLDAMDDLDALVLCDVNLNGVLNPGVDLALFSLSTFSPSAFTTSGLSYAPGVKGRLSPADVLFTDFTGGFTLWAPAGALGLLPDDELDALDTILVGPKVVPEPGSFVLLSFGGFIGAMINRRRRT